MTGAEDPGSSAVCSFVCQNRGTHEASERKKEENRNLLLNLASTQRRVRVGEKINHDIKIMAAAAHIRALGL